MKGSSSTYVIGMVVAAVFVVVLLIVLLMQGGTLLKTSTLGSVGGEILSVELQRVTGALFGAPESTICSIRADYILRNRRESEIAIQGFDVTPLGRGLVYGHQILPQDINDDDTPPATIVGVAQVEKDDRYQLTIEVKDAQTGQVLMRQDTVPCPVPEGFTVSQ